MATSSIRETTRSRGQEKSCREDCFDWHSSTPSTCRSYYTRLSEISFGCTVPSITSTFSIKFKRFIRANSSSARRRPALQAVQRNATVFLGYVRVRPVQTSASTPFLSMRFKSLRDGPLGFFSPISHFCTVETLVLRNAAKTA